jgi:hypothetical protein
MDSNIGMYTDFFLGACLFIIPAVFIIAIGQNRSLIPPPKKRDFGSVLSDWSRQKGLIYTPQKAQVINGVYKDRWFAIGMANEENALRIRMSIKNPRRDSLQIFGDWLEDSEVKAFVNRFRIYGSPSGLGERLFDRGTKLRDVLLRFPGLRARLELFSNPKDPNSLNYSLLTDLPEADTLETILASMHQLCDAYEQQIAEEESVPE